MNSCNLIGVLKDVDNKHPEIRYLLVYREYDENCVEDLIGLINWNKEPKGELFSFRNGSLVGVKGRIEVIFDKPTVVCESIQLLIK